MWQKIIDMIKGHDDGDSDQGGTTCSGCSHPHGEGPTCSTCGCGG